MNAESETVDRSATGGAVDAASDDGASDIGWIRAILSGVAILFVGVLVGVYGANSILTKASSLSRDTRQYLAAGLMFVVVIAMAWALRRLQARKLI